MKTTIELDDDLYREAKVYAARRGITLRELVHAGLQMVMAAEEQPKQRRRVKFPIIESKDPAHVVTSEDVYRAINEADEEEALAYAGFVRR